MATTPKKPIAAPAVAVPAAKKAVTKPAVATKEAAPKAPVAKKIPATKTALKPSTAPAPVLSTEQRNNYVAVAAFYIAERRGFTLGNPVEDWLAAEAEVDRFISSGHFTI
ncbi:DUF2934 domain-containing protein [Rhodoferax antarcticus]|uniref:DUF2934 domain-containing protein n=1 Tax=Rhodoferax antarcticus ANT.BR TaxID=1111071 RepID=A0A1Q8YDX6_9BURK|nr:DUF2934 domain-containing protein [Rhodoferax antarcticus]APW46050.1 hypothetical protein RA876_06295 [Rhodoferax antarcticus]MCW2310383.1 hypothetical protein [Rhodoferax antarcticus]OLP06195.1 hypothetical protein BLL52_2426 [Rhodoferax antarcticus ANT.BR]